MLHFWSEKGQASFCPPCENGTIAEFCDWDAPKTRRRQNARRKEETGELANLFENRNFEEAAKFAASTQIIQTIETMERFVVLGKRTIYMTEFKKKQCL